MKPSSRILSATPALQAMRAADILVSVAIPAYNAEATLAQTLDSVFAQTHRQLDIIVVDDGSTDGTWALLQRYGPLVRAIRQANAGIGAARNTSMQAARGDFIVLLDADDICEPDRIEIQLAYLLAHPDILLCSTDFSSFDAHGELQASTIASYYHRCSPAMGGVRARYSDEGTFNLTQGMRSHGRSARIDVYSGKVYEQIVQGNFIHPGTSMFRREVLAMAGSFDPAVRIACEWEWLVRVARVGPVAYLDLPLLRYRRSGSQISSSPHMSLDSLRVARKIYERDPTLGARQPNAVNRQLGALHLQAAYALAETEPWKALRLLASSVLVYHMARVLTLRTIVKIVMPTKVLSLVRRLRKSNPARI
jgi:glycosyltransferase involved in cell wall biosynthesis